MFTMINFVLLAAGVASAVWVWRDGSKRRDPWAPTWALATLLFFILALPAYLLRIRTRKVSPE